MTMPFERHLLFETTDLDEVCEKVGAVFCKHSIDFAGNGRSLSARQSLVSLGPLALSYITYGEEVFIDAGEPGNWFMVHSIDNGACEMQIGSEKVVGGPAMSVISSASLPLRMRWTANCGHLVLKIDRAALELHLAGLLDDSVTRPIVFEPELATGSQAGASYRRILDFALSEIEHDDSFFASPLGQRQLEKMLMTLLLTTVPHNYTPALTTPMSPAAPRHVMRAESFIRANVHLPISVNEIAAAAGVSVRTLFDGFQRFRGTTPLARLKAVRLERAHADLKSVDQTESITEIALKWGFGNIGRFAHSYKARYGELPSQTKRG